MMGALWQHLWESTLLGALGVALIICLRRNSARIRSLIWFAMSLKFLVPLALIAAAGRHVGLLDPVQDMVPSMLTEVLAESRASALVTGGFALGQTLSNPTGRFDFGLLLVLLWVTGSASLLLRWAAMWIRTMALVRAAAPAALGGPIPTKLSPDSLEPCVVGIFRPVLLIPRGLERLSEEQFRAILTHELCHVQRRDNLRACIHMIVEVLFWFHPLVWWISARLLTERERACDEAVIRSGISRRAYAEAIVEICRLRVGSAPACVAGMAGRDLRKRVEFVMSGNVAQKLSFFRKLMLTIAGIGTIALPFMSGVAAASRSSASVPGPMLLLRPYVAFADMISFDPLALAAQVIPSLRLEEPATRRTMVDGEPLPEPVDNADSSTSVNLALISEETTGRVRVLWSRLDDLRSRYTDRHPAVRCVLGELRRLTSGIPPDDADVIRVGDTLQIYVLGKEELCATVQVRPDGTMSSPLAPDVPAAGKTTPQLATDIELALAEAVRSPEVTVTVLQ